MGSTAQQKAEEEPQVMSEEDSDVETILHAHSKWDDEALASREDAGADKIETIKPWTAAVFPPSRPHGKKSEQAHVDDKDYLLVLDRVHGCSGSGYSNLVLPLASMELLYAAGSVAVVVTDLGKTSTLIQRFFTGHTSEIAAMCLHPDGMTVASADVGSNAKICVWSSEPSSMDTLASPIAASTLHTRGVKALCFSKDGRHVISVGAEYEHTVAVHEWRTGQLLCSQHGDQNPIVAIRCNPHDGCFVTVGVHHVKFWNIRVVTAQEPLPAQAAMTVWQRNLECKRGIFGRHGVGRSRTQLCVDFVGPGMTVTGGKDGSLLLWKGVMVTAAISAHTGPIFTLWALDGEGTTRIATGGKDGKVSLWVIDAVAVLRPAVLTLRVCEACVRSLCWDEQTEDVFCITAHNDIYVLRADKNFSADLVLSSHRRGAVHAVAAHPSQPFYASAGEDGWICLWHAMTGILISRVKIDSAARCLCFSPSGRHIAVGLHVGGVRMLALADANNKLTAMPVKHSVGGKTAVRVVRFSPCGGFLAVGTSKRTVDVVDAPDMRQKIGAFSGHTGAVTHLDWSKDATTVVSTSDTYELVFWQRTAASAKAANTSGYQTKLPAVCADVEWASWTCNLGWPVRGIPPAPGRDEMSVTTVDRWRWSHKLPTCVDVACIST